MPKRRKKRVWMQNTTAQPAVVAHIAKKITANQKRIIEALGEEPFAVYHFLRCELARGNVHRNPLFQFVYRSYYRLDSAGLHPRFKARYFQLMEDARVSGQLSLPGIATDLHRYKTLRKHKSLQFSFVTKLAATVDPVYPIYDRAVGDALGFPPPAGGKYFAQGLERCMRFYEWLGTLYNTFLADSMLSAPMAALKAQYPLAASLPPIKAIDFLVWSAGKLRIVLVPS